MEYLSLGKGEVFTPHKVWGIRKEETWPLLLIDFFSWEEIIEVIYAYPKCKEIIIICRAPKFRRRIMRGLNILLDGTTLKKIKGFDSLENISRETLKMKKYNCLINPPYNKDKTESTHNGGTRGSAVLWPEIIKRLQDSISEDSIISGITPLSILKNNNNWKQLLFDHEVLDFELDVTEFFPGIGEDICAWTIRIKKQKGDFNQKTLVIDPSGEEKEIEGFSKMLVYPQRKSSLEDIEIFRTIFDSKFPKLKWKVNKIENSHLRKKKSKKFPYKVYKGKQIEYTDLEHKDYRKPKTMIAQVLARDSKESGGDGGHIFQMSAGKDIITTDPGGGKQSQYITERRNR